MTFSVKSSLFGSCTAAVLFVLTLAGSRASGEDWPQWRGRNRDGVSRETGLLTDWRERSPKIVWQRPLGLGFSSFAVADGRLYTLAATNEEEFVYCLDAATGETLWSTRSGGTYEDQQGGNGPRSTPTVADGVVYALGAEGDLLCLDALTGEANWRRNVLQDFQTENLHWGVSTSPYLDGERLLVNVGGKGASIVAFQRSSGATLWKNLDDVAGYSSPIRIDVTGPRGEVVPEVVFFCGRSLVGVSPHDGAEHWRFEWLTTSDMNIATPIFDTDRQILFVSAARDTGRCAAYKLSAGNGTVSATMIYTNEELRNHHNSSVLLGGYVYGYDNNRILKCLQLETGNVMWSNRSVGKGSLVAAEGHLFMLGEHGEVAVVEATADEYREKGRFQALDSTRAWTPPVLSDGRLYIRDLENAVCVDISAH